MVAASGYRRSGLIVGNVEDVRNLYQDIVAT
jgi:hypothetical protein